VHELLEVYKKFKFADVNEKTVGNIKTICLVKSDEK